MYDLVALGESLIDFTPSGTNEQGMQMFSRNPGGAPANVLAMFAKLGGNTAFIGKVGDDGFGRFLTRNMADAGIDTRGVRVDKTVPTTLAFVQLDEHGDRSFSFYRNPGADIMLAKEEVPDDLVKNCRIFHFGSVSLTEEPCRTATIEAAKAARSAGAILSYDPNYRPLLWHDEVTAKREMQDAMQLANLVKVSEEEMCLLTGKTDLEAGAAELEAMGPAVVLVTLGPDGAYFHTRRANGLVPTYAVKAVDTNGAGDAFLGALLWKLAQKPFEMVQKMVQEEWKQAVEFANAAGSLTTTKSGAISAMPEKNSIESCVRQTALLKTTR